jgi:hypothetical protein
MARSVVFVSTLFLTVPGAYASHGEFELFDKGYEYYLSYQPERAVETFRAFLRDFPESSAKDAAMFWLGKSFVQIRSVEEAKRVFSELKQQCPGSPLIPYVDREIEDLAKPENLRKADTKSSGKVPETGRPETDPGGGLKEAEKKIHILEGQLAAAADEKNRLGALLEDEKKKTADMRATMTEVERKGAEFRNLMAKGEDTQKKGAAEMEQSRTETTKGKERSGTELYAIQKDSPQAQRLIVTIKEKKYTGEEVIDFMINSSTAMTKAGVREILWRSGSLFEDFISEQILFDEAKGQNVVVDAKQLEELAEKVRLTPAEAEYLRRYLAISYLIDGKIRNMPEDRVVESLTVRYTERDKQEKVELANELQAQAKAGRSFEEIFRAFPNKMQLSTVGFEELQGWIKERIELLPDGEVSVVWTKDGYMILRPALKKASYRPFEEIRPGRKNEIRAFVRDWIDELRREIKEIGVAKVE